MGNHTEPDEGSPARGCLVALLLVLPIYGAIWMTGRLVGWW